MLDPYGVTRTKALGTERMARKLGDALPSGQHPLRSAVWDFVRPMLSPRLAELHRDAFVLDDGPRSTVDLDVHHGGVKPRGPGPQRAPRGGGVTRERDV